MTEDEDRARAQYAHFRRVPWDSGQPTASDSSEWTPPLEDPPQPAPVARSVTVGLTATLASSSGAAAHFASTPARALHLEEAEQVLLDLHGQHVLTVSGAAGEHRHIINRLQSLPWGVRIGNLRFNGGPFTLNGDVGATPAIDPRLAVCIVRLCELLAGMTPRATGIRHMGLYRPEERVWFDCHNQGRAIDFSGVDFGEERVMVLDHWGKLPILVPGTPAPRWATTSAAIVAAIGQLHASRTSRLDPNIRVTREVVRAVRGVDPGEDAQWSAAQRAEFDALQTKLRLAARVFLAAFNFLVQQSTATLRAGRAYASSPEPPLTTVSGGAICEPDHLDQFAEHQDHIHFQVGMTGWTADPYAPHGLEARDISQDDRTELYSHAQQAIGRALHHIVTTADDAVVHARQAFEAQQRRARHRAHPDVAPASEVRWEDQPGAAALLRTARIARAAYEDPTLMQRIQTVDGVDEVRDGWKNHQRALVMLRAEVLGAWAELFRPTPIVDVVGPPGHPSTLRDEDIIHDLLTRTNARLDTLEQRIITEATTPPAPPAHSHGGTDHR